MSTKQWTPHPATLAYRVMKYLRELPRGKFVATGPLAAEMCQPSAALITALLRPVEHGFMLREKRGGFYHWALTDEGWDLDLDGDDANPAPKPTPAPAPKPALKPTKWDGPVQPAVRPAPQPKAKAEPATISETITDGTKWGDSDEGGVDMDKIHEKRSEPEPEHEPDPEPDPVGEVVPPDEPFRYSWSSDRELSVSKGGQSVSMSPEEYAELAMFVRVIEGFRPREAA